ncbi:HicB family protein [Desulfonauticus submarinus]|uniref:HicB family protein n=1 Tax=Desulfonauticus submarinus TaxID=206665 RepID=A0A1H0CUZ1_9BACT|nr:YlcI/YnfO family protein [Desulfonauticus submarinus]SDN61674.1 HicB family protein [Desulfonauticus submarinus]
MSTLSVHLPKSLHKTVQELSKKEGVSINQFIVSALSEKISALMTLEYLKEKQKNASKEKFLNALNDVPDVEPLEDDKLY